MVWQSQAAHDQVSCWVEGSCPQGPGLRVQADPSQHLGTDSYTPKPPGHSHPAHCPQLHTPPIALLSHPGPRPPKPALTSPSEPSHPPHTSPPLFLPVENILTLPSPAQMLHPPRNLRNHPCCQLVWEKSAPPHHARILCVDPQGWTDPRGVVVSPACSPERLRSLLPITFFKNSMALAGVAKWIEHRTVKQRVASSIPSQDTCQVPRGGCERQPHIDVYLSPFPSLKINK